MTILNLSEGTLGSGKGRGPQTACAKWFLVVLRSAASPSPQLRTTESLELTLL